MALGTGGVLAVPAVAQAAVGVGAQVVISEVFGGGGNTGAPFKNDFIELYNKSAAPIVLSAYSIQYTSATGATWSNKTNLTGSIAPGGHYLVQEASQAAVGAPLPTPDAVGTIAMSGTAGKVALVNTQTALTCGTDCDGNAAVVDFVGFGSTANDFAGTGAAPAPSNTTSVARNAAVANTANNAADFKTGAPTPKAATGGSGPVDPPVDPVAKTIEEIQGTAAASTLVGTNVTTSGVVTAAYPTGGFNGYVIQAPGTGGAIDFATHTGSDAVFVYSVGTVADVAIGDHVQVTGIVAEYAGQTQLNAPTGGLTKLTDTVATPTPATATLPTTDAQRETLEGMLYAPSGSYTITNNFGTNSYGELGLATGTTPLIQPTEIAKPKTAAYDAAVADNEARGIVLDDGSSTNFLSAANSGLVPPYLAAAADTGAIAPRVGAAVTFTQPVIFSQGGSPTAPTYRFQPRQQAVGGDAASYPATWTGTRTNAPDVAKIGDADIKVASFNVLNFFTKLGVDVAGCTSFNDRAGNPITVNRCPGNGPRGAWNTASFDRQRAKIVDAILASGVDVAGLMEIENSIVLGENVDLTVADLVAALNAKTAPNTWDYVASSGDLPAVSEMDVINNAIIYQPAKVTPQGGARALGTESASGQAFDNAREPIAQKFLPTSAGADPFLLVVNHFKSKGSGSGPDADQGDGQAASNYSRVRQATALNTWIDSINTSNDAVIAVGDYNSYSQEDPLQVLYSAGYADAEHVFEVGKYSYSFSGLSGSLDHALLNAKMQARATGADIWNINSPESVTAEYSRYNYHGALYYQDNPFGASDHDPVIVGIKAKNAPVTQKITLLNINDFHGRIDASSPTNSNTVKFAGTVEQLRAAGGENNTVLLSAGDNVGASLYASSFEKDKPTIDVLNALDLKASAVGNHEFDKGFDDLQNRINKPYDATTNPLGGADWKYLGANVYLKGTTTPALPEYQIITVDGVKVGVIGAVTQETPTLVTPAGISDLDFGDPVDAVNRVAAQLTDGDPANGEADVLVAEYHEGAGAGGPDGATIDQEVAAGGAFAKIVTQTSAKVSAIFTGHTHKQYAWEYAVPGVAGATRPILQTGSYGENIGEITLTVTDGVVTAHTQRNVPRTTVADATLVATYPRVAAVQQITNAAVARAAVAGSVPVGSVAADITTAFFGAGAGYTGAGNTFTAPSRDDRANESALGDLVADALVEQLKTPQYGSAEIGVVNPGGLRAELLKGDDGVITTAEAISVLPFANNLNTVTLTGAQFKTLLEQQWQTNADGTIPSRPYLALGLSRNVTYTYDVAAALGSHITSITINGEPYSAAADYRIGTFSFLISGGDNFRIFKDGTDMKDSGLVDRDAWISFLQSNPGLLPDFARQGVSLPQAPSTVVAGQNLSFTVGGLNLTSLGSPQNTSVEVKLGDSALGSVPVTSTTLPGALPDANLVGNGTATVAVTVPAGTAGGSYTVTATALPSGTTVTFPVTVTATTAETTTTLTATSAVQVYLPTSAPTLTARVVTSAKAPGVGSVRFKRDGELFATVTLNADGVASVPAPGGLLPGTFGFTAEFVPATPAQSASVSSRLAFRVALVTTTVAVSARVVTLSAADQKKFKVVSGLVVTSTVRGNGSKYVPAGKVHVNIRGKVTTMTLSGGRAVSPVIPTAKSTVTVFSTFEPTGSPVLATRSLGRVSATVPR